MGAGKAEHHPEGKGRVKVVKCHIENEREAEKERYHHQQKCRFVFLAWECHACMLGQADRELPAPCWICPTAFVSSQRRVAAAVPCARSRQWCQQQFLRSR